MVVKLCDLFADTSTDSQSRRAKLPKPWRLDWERTAFRFQLHALDQRIKAESILSIAHGMHPSDWSDTDLHEALEAVARCYADEERAGLLEDIAFNLRARGLATERNHVPSRSRAT